MKTGSKIALTALFAIAAGTGYEAVQLNKLVWSAPEKGEVRFQKLAPNEVVGEMPLDVFKGTSLLKQESDDIDLYVHFARDSGQVTQVCVQHDYSLSGIFRPDRNSPIFFQFQNGEHLDSRDSDRFFDGRLRINDKFSISTTAPGGCDPGLAAYYSDKIGIIQEAYRQKYPDRKPNP